jgi:hypothetical protein
MKTLRRFVSGPCIARLLGCHRDSVNEAMHAGRYGRTFKCGRIFYVALAEVERVHGLNFPDDQLDRASDGLPDRILTIPSDTQEAVHGPS